MKSIPFNKIDREGRIRQQYSNVEQLADNIYHHGLIHAITISPDAKLIAGGRRSKAIEHLLDNPETYPPSQAHEDIASLLETGELVFGKHFKLRTVADLAELTTLELIENVERESMTWQEQCLAVHRIHTQKNKEAISNKDLWYQKHTASLLKISNAQVTLTLRLASALRDEDSPLWKIATITEGLQELVRLEHEKGAKILAERLKGSVTTSIEEKLASLPVSKLEMVESQATPSASDVPIFVDEFAHLGELPEDQADSEPAIDYLEKAKSIVHLSKMEDFARKHQGEFDHIITDPPYAIDMEGSLVDTKSVNDTHKPEENKKDLEIWLKACYKALKQDGFCIWFCAPEMWHVIRDLAVKLKFKYQPWPFIWQKPGFGLNRQAQFNMTKDYEMAIVLRKGSAQVIKPIQSAIFSCRMSDEDIKQSKGHPFAKPTLLWQHLFTSYVRAGQKIWEPFSGSGSATVAALKLGIDIVATESEEVHYIHQLENLEQLLPLLK